MKVGHKAAKSDSDGQGPFEKLAERDLPLEADRKINGQY